MQTHVSRILQAKGDAVYGVEIRTPLADAIRRMAEHKIGSLLVFEDKLVIGIITERDLVRRVLFAGVDPATTFVEAVMSAPVAYVTPATTVAEAMKVMSETKTRHLPVFAEGQLIGLVSLGDLIRNATEDLEIQVLHLESYIRGR